MQFYEINNVLLVFPFPGFGHVPGNSHVVLGDLVYSKEQCIEPENRAIYSECEDGSSNDTQDSSHLDEISETDLQEEKYISVKASFLFIYNNCLLDGSFNTSWRSLKT